MSRNRKPFPPVNRKVRSSVPSRLPPLVQSSPSTDEELKAVAAEGKALVRAQLEPAQIKSKIPKVLGPIRREKHIPSPPPRRPPCTTEGSKIPIRTKLRKNVQPLPAIPTVSSTQQLDNKPRDDKDKETQCPNSTVTVQAIDSKPCEVLMNDELCVETKPVLSTRVHKTGDHNMKKKLLKQLNSKNEKQLQLLPSRFSPVKIPQQGNDPGSDPGQEMTDEMRHVFEQFKKLHNDLLQMQSKYTQRCVLQDEAPVLEMTGEVTPCQANQFKDMVNKMTKTVNDFDSGLEYEQKCSRKVVDDFNMCFNQTKEKLNKNLILQDKALQAFRDKVERLQKENIELKKSLKEKEIYEGMEFEYLEGLVENSFWKDKADERSKEVKAINESLKKNLDCRVREVKNLRSDMRRRANCPISVIEEYNTLRNERNGINVQLAQLNTDINEAAKRRMNIDAVNQKLKKQIEKLKTQVKELGGVVPATKEPEKMVEKFSFSKPEAVFQPAGKSIQEENRKKDCTKDNIVNQNDAENERQKLNVSSVKMTDKDIISVKGISDLLQGVSNQLQGNKVDLSLTVESPKAVRFYFNSDFVTKEVSRLQRQFLLRTVKDTTVKGEGVVYKRIGKKKVRVLNYKRRVRELLSTVYNDREMSYISEENVAVDAENVNETTTSPELEPEQEADISKEYEVVGDVLLLLKR